MKWIWPSRWGVLRLVGFFSAVLLAYFLWSPGESLEDGRHDLGNNALWLGHGWLGADEWFELYQKDSEKFRDEEEIHRLAEDLRSHHISRVYPHLCPAGFDRKVAPSDVGQVERFLDGVGDVEVLPWIGGVLDTHCHVSNPEWRGSFLESVQDLLERHPRLRGVHLNIEPMPSGHQDFLVLLEECRAVLPEGMILSVAAYPPPTVWHRFPDVHWEEEYYREVASRCDEMVPMMYDTAVRLPKVYEKLMSDWTLEVLEWAGSTETRLGLPAYDDAGVGYHDPDVENLYHSLRGIHAGLKRAGPGLPENYAGVAVYSEWEMAPEEWALLRASFLLPEEPSEREGR